jgi:hypothetical protein
MEPGLVDACWEVVRPQLSLLQGSGAYGAAQPAPAGNEGDSQASLLAALGRSA